MSFLLVNKPAGITSHDVIDRLRRISGIRKIGHAGTLDPFATGLLLVAIERSSTKRLGEFLKLDKRYRATIFFGATSDTQDVTGAIIPRELVSERTEQDVRKVLPTFTGHISQIPPMYSAKKIGGKKLYELARRGEEIVRPAHDIEIYSIEIVWFAWPRAVIDVHCGSGTYIRTLCADIGETLGVGAYCEVLERTAIGDFTEDSAIELSDLNHENWENFCFEM